MGKFGCRCVEGLVQFQVLTGVGKVIFTANDVRNLHGDIIHNVYKVEYGRPVRPVNNEVFFFQTLDGTVNDVVDRLNLTGYFKPNGPIFFVNAILLA